MCQTLVKKDYVFTYWYWRKTGHGIREDIDTAGMQGHMFQRHVFANGMNRRKTYPKNLICPTFGKAGSIQATNEQANKFTPLIGL